MFVLYPALDSTNMYEFTPIKHFELAQLYFKERKLSGDIDNK